MNSSNGQGVLNVDGSAVLAEPAQFSSRAMRLVARETLAGERPTEVLQSKASGKLVVRVTYGDTHTLVLKFFLSSRWKCWLRRLSRMGTASREYQTMLRLATMGVPVPHPYAAFNFRPRGDMFVAPVDVLACQDLGPLTDGLKHTKSLFWGGHDTAMAEWEASLIDLTARMVAGGVIDMDHRLANCVLDSQHRLFRIDFECARHLQRPERADTAYGTMLGKLVGSYAFAVQPHVEHAQQFTQRLYDHLKPSPPARAVCLEFVRNSLERQQERRGIPFDLDWLQRL